MSERHGNEIVPVDDPNERQESPKPARGDPKTHRDISPEALARSESGEPGGGAGRRDDVGRTGVYPLSGDERPSGEAELRPLGDWAGGDRGIQGYEDSGGSELVMRDGEVLGGLTSDGSGRPTIDIHGGDAGAREAREAERARQESADTPGPDDDRQR